MPPRWQSRAEALAGTIDEVANAVPAIAALDPDVLVRPFAASTENVVVADLETVDFYTPAAVVLLLQHLALTFAALSLVRDRSLGLFELLRAGPLSSFEILAGKTIAYLLVGLGLGGILMAGGRVRPRRAVRRRGRRRRRSPWGSCCWRRSGSGC